ncbi:CHAT domain-containing protein [Streptosporangium sp. NPDC051022]|uniref:CHAT domain-containing protein n=1 Tax=Streptosporangium sp. NPDC051022 TaxID=3155752 RepID=UPI0034208B34
MREKLLAAIRARNASAIEAGDSRPVLDPAALEEMQALLAFVGASATDSRNGPDLEVLHSVGWLCWLRVLALPVGEWDEDMRCAVMLFGPVFANDPQAVPETLREFYEKREVLSGDDEPFDDDRYVPEHLVYDPDYHDSFAEPESHDSDPFADPDADATAADLTDQGVALYSWHERTGDHEALQKALQLFRAALAAVPRDHPKRDLCRSNLVSALGTWYELSEDPEAIHEMIAVFRTASGDLPDDHPDRVDLLSDLSAALRMLFERTGDLEAMHEAVAVRRAVIGSATRGHLNRAEDLTDLGSLLRRLFEHVGNPETLREAVGAHRSAVAATPDGAAELAGRLSSLGGALQTLFECTGDVEALREAVAAGRRAVAALPHEHPDRAMCLANLGVSLRTMFEHIGDVGMLHEAAGVHRTCAAVTPEGHPYRGSRLSNLGNTLLALAEQTGDPAVLREAVEVARAALAATPDSHPDHAAYVSNLGNALHALAETTGDPGALVEAIGMARAAVAATPDGHAIKPRYLNSLGAGLTLLFRDTGELGALREAIAAGRAAVALSDDTWPELCDRLLLLGSALRNLFERSGDRETLTEARELFARAAALRTAAVSDRIAAGHLKAETDTLAGDDAAALSAMEEVVRMLPLMASRDLRRKDREHRLGEMAGIAGRASAAALSAGRPERALELLEQARGLLLAEDMESRTEQARLRAQAPDLADDFVRLCERFAQLEAAAHRDVASGIPREGDHEPASRRHEAATAWDALLDRIRARPGLADFLIPPPIDRLRRQAAAGPVVMVTTDPHRCDALILTDDPERPVRHVPLTGLTEDDVYLQGERFLAARRTAVTASDTFTRRRAQADLHDVLGWLWDTVAAPVLAELGHTATPAPGREWPRLWWCPVGVMAYLPLHAAGHHHDIVTDGASPRTVMDRVVSSYTTTVRALAYARRSPTPSDVRTAGHRPALIVAMPSTPGARPLPGADDEARRLSGLLRNATLLRGPHATHQAVLAALPAHSVVHFACHGTSDWNDPGASRLLLFDHTTRPLTVSAISRLRLTGADLAYLSACETSDTHPRFVDEGVHITAAFQLAGFRNTIGTLWSINDQVAARVAEEVYTQLTDEGSRTADTSRTALALHNATRHLRAALFDTPTLWACHVHTGA